MGTGWHGNGVLGDHPALSVRQPWAELIIAGRKSIEVRNWWTDYRGLLWIHAARKADVELEQKFGLVHLFKGGFIGRVTLTAIVRFDSERWNRWREKHLSGGSMPCGAYGWVLKEPLRLKEPVPAEGALRLFRPNDDVVRTLRALLPPQTNDTYAD